MLCDCSPITYRSLHCYLPVCHLPVVCSLPLCAAIWERYGYDYTCTTVDTPSSNCHITSAVQLAYPAAAALLSRAVGGRQWQANASTPFFYYKVKLGGSSGWMVPG